MFNLNNVIRENVKSLTPYASARTEFTGERGVFLDANENPFNSPYNRYPDPLQLKVKEKLAFLKGVKSNEIFLGNGSDEAIDLLIRAFCEPRLDNIVSIYPSYGMYQVAADINAVEFKKVALDENFAINLSSILKVVDNHTKLIMLCSPNNPTANSLDNKIILELLDKFNGVVMVDEAYIDFSEQTGLVQNISKYPNLVILQTFSKAWGMAALRLGIAFASSDIIEVLNKIKYPYNVNKLTQQIVLKALNNVKQKDNRVKEIIFQREELIKTLSGLNLVKHIYPSDANFVLVKFEDARKIYEYLINRQVIVRDRSRVQYCEGCLRITIGSRLENKKLFNALIKFEKENNV